MQVDVTSLPPMMTVMLVMVMNSNCYPWEGICEDRQDKHGLCHRPRRPAPLTACVNDWQRGMPM